ncbi:MAG: prephenate dehydrogenase [bacterium]|nr:MAG: prephenate dehydrogenase [bacterium]KAF0148845.1 MAG: prephenate dehydrogenase [bacterium]KAF0168246.1 MAG: prephenate dehydrogenase [bacterium]TXT20275.1 MAG: prephenate dehydrogenase [bacterium]
MIGHLVVVGVGLIGGSFALDLRKQGLVRRVTGVGRGRANLEKARQLGIIDAIADSVAEAVADADLVLLAIPVGAMPAVFRAIAPALPPACIVTDAGSTKQDVVAAARAALGDKLGRFVPGHPIAGAETSGAEAARAGLFQHKPVILTPLAENAPATVDTIADLWKACGAQVSLMQPDRHDHVFAAVSHLPHMVAFALMEELAGRPDADLYFHHAGSGFRDFTRIAGSHPEMWRDISMANKEALVTELDAFIAKLSGMRNLLASGDSAALEALFARAREARLHRIKGRPH